jgi:hypothetical protein
MTQKEAATTTLAIASGMRGVGRASLCASLAVRLAALGRRVAVVGAGADGADAALSGHGVRWVALGGSRAAGRDDPAVVAGLAEALAALRPDHDVILVDAGPGNSRTVVDCVLQCDHALLVTTDTFAAVADTYGTVKMLVQGGFEGPLHLLINRVASATRPNSCGASSPDAPNGSSAASCAGSDSCRRTTTWRRLRRRGGRSVWSFPTRSRPNTSGASWRRSIATCRAELVRLQQRCRPEKDEKAQERVGW